MPSHLAPVVLFAYARPEHLRRTVASLLRNPEVAATHVTVYCDAAKKPEHQAAVDAVRAFVDSISGFASVTRIHRPENMGLARSIVEGVTETLRAHDRVIVLEDDLELSPHFLGYMNDGLACYRDDEQVASIHGYCYATDRPLPETYFLKGADCWGWGTWSRAWAHFEPDGRRLLAGVRAKCLEHEIDYDGNYPHMKILRHQISGKNDSWAIRWHVSCYLQNMLTLYPNRSLVDNIGHDDSGTNCRSGDTFAGMLTARAVTVERIEVAPSDEARAAVVDFFRARKRNVFQKVLDQLGRRASKATNLAILSK
jgi:Glycosyl transferase family 2